MTHRNRITSDGKRRVVKTTSPPSPPTYPLGVLGCGLQTVYNARPSYSGALSQSLPSALPAGCSIDTTVVLGQPLNWFQAGTPFTQSGFTFDGYTTYANNGAYSITNFRLHHDVNVGANSILLGVGHENGGGGIAHVVYSNGIIDQQTTAASTGKVQIGKVVDIGGPKSSAIFNSTSFINIGSIGIIVIGDMTGNDVYFEAPGQIVGGGHSENIQVRHGIVVLNRSFFDARTTGPSDAPTGQIFLAPVDVGASADVTVNDGILAGASAAGLPVAINVGGAGAGRSSRLRLNNVTIQAGNTGPTAYVAVSAVAGTTIDILATGCKDYDTGASIDAIINAL